MEEKDFFRIVVKVPPPIGEAFIATPFSKEFAPIVDAIEHVVNKAGLKPYTLTAVSNKNMMQECCDRLRQAELLIAVCSPEKGKTIPNANVMFELGFAFCIGKPYIILIDDVKSLPFDINQCQAMVYKKRDVGQEAFKDKLQIAINSCRAEVYHKLVHPSFRDTVNVFDSMQWFFAEPVLCGHFLELLSFACDVQDNLSLLDQEYLDPLINTYLSASPSNCVLQKQRVGLFRHLHKFDELAGSLVRAEQSLQMFKSGAPSHGLEVCGKYVSEMREQMDRCAKLSESARAMTGLDLRDDEFMKTVTALQVMTSELETSALGLFKNLLSMIKEAEKND